MYVPDESSGIVQRLSGYNYTDISGHRSQNNMPGVRHVHIHSTMNPFCSSVWTRERVIHTNMNNKRKAKPEHTRKTWIGTF